MAACAFLVAATAVTTGCGSEQLGGSEPIRTAPSYRPSRGELDTHAAQGPVSEPIFTPPPKTPGPDPYVYSPPEPSPEPTATPTPEPTIVPPRPAGVRAATVSPPAADTILAIIASYDWPFDEAVAVAQCESGFNPNAYNPSGATGLYQIMFGPFDIHANVAAAYAKYLDGLRRGNRWWHWNQFGGCGHFY